MFVLVIPESEPDSHCSGSNKPLQPLGKGLVVLYEARFAISCSPYFLFSRIAVTSGSNHGIQDLPLVFLQDGGSCDGEPQCRL